MQTFFCSSLSFTFVARNLKERGTEKGGGRSKGGGWVAVEFSFASKSLRPHKDDTGSQWNILGFHVGFVKYSIVGKENIYGK